MPGDFAAAALISSPLRRAEETARIVGRRNPAIEPALIEMDWGAWEGRRGVDLLADPHSGYCHIEEWGWDFRPPNGETPATVWQRLQPLVARLRVDTVAVTHVGVMRTLLARATGWEYSGPSPFKVKRDRLYVIEISDGGALRFDNRPLHLVKAEP